MELEQAFDELYAAEPEDFVGERSRLAKSLREGGRREDAQVLAKAKKPPLAAWAINQLARRNRRDVDLLLDAGSRLRDAQAGLLGGAEPDAFARARRAERDAVSSLTREAEKLLAARGGASPSVLGQVADTLGAAAVLPEGRELLARGRFTEPMSGQGFDALGELAAATPRPKPRRGKEARQEERRRASEALREAKTRLRELERAAREARGEAARLERQAEKAREAAEAADAAVEAAERAVAEAEAELRRTSR
jgi:hypothetical protein